MKYIRATIIGVPYGQNKVRGYTKGLKEWKEAVINQTQDLPTRAQSTYTPYAFTNFAGTPGASGTNDGSGSEARLYYPYGVAVDSAGNVYVGDRFNHTIRKITPGGDVTTLAGSASNPGTNNGTGSEARFYYPSGVAVDGAGNVYVGDSYNYTIRKITLAGVVTTLAGSAE